MDKETIKKARQANLAEYLISVGVPLIQKGNRYRHREHDSLTFTENAYYWNSRQEHGNAIDYLVRHMDMDFKDAVSALANDFTAPISARNVQGKFNFEKVQLHQNADKVKNYLIKTRLIGNSVINHLIKGGLLFQEERTNNALFPMFDENNKCVGVEKQGTLTGKRFKGIGENSKYGYGFNVRFSKNNEFDYALFFESAVDLMSFIDLKINIQKKDLRRCVLVSMAGLKPNIIIHSMKVFKGNFKIVLCVDNDSAGQTFIEEIKNSKTIPAPLIISPDPQYKDWNAQLEDLKRGSKPIARLMNHQELSPDDFSPQPFSIMRGNFEI